VKELETLHRMCSVRANLLLPVQSTDLNLEHQKRRFERGYRLEGVTRVPQSAYGKTRETGDRIPYEKGRLSGVKRQITRQLAESQTPRSEPEARLQNFRLFRMTGQLAITSID